MSDETLSFEEHRRRRDKDPTRVRCARCGKLIPMNAIRCPLCGVHFQGEAFQFTHPSERARGQVGAWVVVTALLVIAALVIGVAVRW